MTEDYDEDEALLAAMEADLEDEDLDDDLYEEPPVHVIAKRVVQPPPPEPAKPRKGGPPVPIMSGHCSFPQTASPSESHARCARNGAGSRANPEKKFHPCPCPCHFPGEKYDCECGATIVVAPYLGLDEDGDEQYVHVDRNGRMLYVDCR